MDANMEQGKPLDTSALNEELQVTKEYWDSRLGLPQERVYQLAIQYQMVSPANIQMNNIIETERAVLVYLRIDMYVKKE